MAGEAYTSSRAKNGVGLPSDVRVKLDGHLPANGRSRGKKQKGMEGKDLPLRWGKENAKSRGGSRQVPHVVPLFSNRGQKAHVPRMAEGGI